MNIIFTMAGKYSRFKLFANRVPKYLMPLGKHTILWHVINELKAECGPAQFFFIVNKEDRDFFPIMKSVLDDFAISTKNIIHIDDTKSQLETALAIFDSSLSEKVNINSPTAFTNIDTILRFRSNFFQELGNLGECEGLLDTFRGASIAYSYALVDKNNKVLSVSDGIRVSDDACSGLYGFSSGAFFASEARRLLSQDEKANFTGLYHSLMESHYDSFITRNLDINSTTVLGTPEEYISNIHRFK